MATLEEIAHLRLPDDASDFIYAATTTRSKFEELTFSQDRVVLIRVGALQPANGYAYYLPVVMADLPAIFRLCGKQYAEQSPNNKVMLRFLDYSTISTDRLKHILEIVRLAAIGRRAEKGGEQSHADEGLGLEGIVQARLDDEHDFNDREGLDQVQPRHIPGKE